MIIDGKSQRLPDDEKIAVGEVQKSVGFLKQMEGGFQDYTPQRVQVRAWIFESMKDLGIKV